MTAPRRALRRCEGGRVLAQRRADPCPVLRLQEPGRPWELASEDQQAIRRRGNTQASVALQRHGVREQPLRLVRGEPPVGSVHQFDDIGSFTGGTDPASPDRPKAAAAQLGFDRGTIALVHEQIPISPHGW